MKIIKRYISQKCIGYQKDKGNITHIVLECMCEWDDGTSSRVYELQVPDSYELSDLYEECPRIDIAV